jgi:hypothetical protein
MKQFTMTHELDCDPERFWKLFFDKDFNEKLFRTALEFPEYKVLDIKEDDDKIVRKVQAQPHIDAPGPVKKVLGSGFGYSETGTFDKKSRVWSFVITPNSMADKMTNKGSVRVEPAGPGKCKRIVDVHLEAKIFAIGGALEGSLEKTYVTSWGKSADFINRWVKEHA